MKVPKFLVAMEGIKLPNLLSVLHRPVTAFQATSSPLMIYNGGELHELCHKRILLAEVIITRTEINFKNFEPQWFERLSKLLYENVYTDNFLWSHYSEINSYKGCAVGEAYDYDSSYAVAGFKNVGQSCVELSGYFHFKLGF
jgi:hypothetical protein